MCGESVNNAKNSVYVKPNTNANIEWSYIIFGNERGREIHAHSNVVVFFTFASGRVKVLHACFLIIFLFFFDYSIVFYY